MKKHILITGAGGPAAIGFTRSLLECEDMYPIGVDCDKFMLQGAETHLKFLVPKANDPSYVPVMKDIVREHNIVFIHAQPDVEIPILQENFPDRVFLPNKKTIQICQDKFQSYELWRKAFLSVPETIMLDEPDDIRRAFGRFGSPIWIRAIKGAAGNKSFPAKTIEMAVAWLNHYEGWGKFSAAEYLMGVDGKWGRTSVTWTSLWKDGELVVAQGRERLTWAYADRAPSGITGLTGIGKTVSDAIVDSIAVRAIKAIDEKPHGIFSVDLTEDKDGTPCPTEINIGRFFTTHQFFTEAGLNMPEIYVRVGLGEDMLLPAVRVNPLPTDLYWIRSIDREPVLVKHKMLVATEKALAERLARIKA